jgi:hypothetical protein
MQLYAYDSMEDSPWEASCSAGQEVLRHSLNTKVQFWERWIGQHQQTMFSKDVL